MLGTITQVLPAESPDYAVCVTHHQLATAIAIDVADQHDLGVGGDVLLEDWALLLPAEGLVVPRSIRGLSGRKVTQVKPALGTHGHHQVLSFITHISNPDAREHSLAGAGEPRPAVIVLIHGQLSTGVSHHQFI